MKIEMTPYDLKKGRIVYRFLPGAIIPNPSSPSTGEAPSLGTAA